MKPKVNQGSLFCETVRKTAVTLPSKPKAPPNLTLVGGLNETVLRADSVYILRILAGHSVRSLTNQNAKKNLLETVKAEICLKRGKLPPELILKNIFIKKS